MQTFLGNGEDEEGRGQAVRDERAPKERFSGHSLL